MSKKKPTTKKSCAKSCKKKNCGLKSDAQKKCTDPEPVSTSSTSEIKTPQNLGVFWYYLKKKLGL